MREWDIPFDDLNLGDALGTGHFGTVYRGSWYGDVAIKVLNMDQMGDIDMEKTLEAFKLEVGICHCHYLLKPFLKASVDSY